MKTQLQHLYWTNELANSPPETTLFKNQRQAPRSLSRQLQVELPPALANELARLSRQSDLSLYLVLLTALAIVVHKYTDREDLIIGSSIPLRLMIKGERSLKSQLLDVRRRVLLAYVNQEHTLESVSGLNLILDDLTLCFSSTSLSGSAIFNANLFDESTIRRVVDHFTSVLQSMVYRPDLTIDGISLLTEEEERQLLFDFSRGPERQIAGKLTHRVFEAQAQKTPNAIAVTCEDESLTYAQLNASANRVARALQRCEVKPETIVMVLLRRGINLLTTMLALFKSGGVYLPLDPNQPPARLAQLITDSKGTLLVTSEEFREHISQVSQTHKVVFIEDLLNELEYDQNLAEWCDPANLGYVIYTSGSTGAPKGAMLEHRGMFNHLDAKVSELALSQSDVVAQTASQCFDISLWQFLAVLMVGGRVHIVSDDAVKEPSQLLNQVTRESVSVLEVVPSQLRAILQTIEFSGAPVELPRLRFLLVTGEVLPPSLCRQWFELFPQTPLVNAYGPTECSDDVTHHVIRNSPPPEATDVPIGRSVQNMQVYVLGRGLRLAPIGIPGEIYVGGIGVGRGYLHDPKRTAEVYLPDPLSREPGLRLYYTGDVGWCLPDGNVQFGGRHDHQVKVRGFRIELGEIESALREHPAVDDAVVLATEDGRLQAYVGVGLAVGHDASKRSLRQFIRGRLPEHMIPSDFILLDALPLNSNGKVDRNALPSLELMAGGLADDFLPPATQIEKTLANIWARNLKVTQVSLGDNFFELGGNSLLSIQVLNQIRAALNIELPMKVLLESATLGDVADNVSRLIHADITDQCPNNVIVSLTQP